MTDPRPLWKVMIEAARNQPVDGISPSADTRSIVAAEIEALADAVVPEEPPFVSDSAPDDPIWARWDQRLEIRRYLLAEAERAEGGQS